MSDFSYDLKREKGSISHLKLRGFLNENCTLPDPDLFSKTKELYIDFFECLYMNSSGVKKWLIFCDQLNKFEQLETVFQKCPIMFIELVQLIEGLLPNKARIESISVPLYCTKCEEEFNVIKSARYCEENIDSLIYDLKELGCNCASTNKSNIEIDCSTEIFNNLPKK